MALLDRVKARIETSLADPELQLLIDEALQDIIDQYGPNADPAVPIVVLLEGSERRRVRLLRPIDSANAIVVKETIDAYNPALTTTLVATDYRLWNGGRSLERLWTGTNPRYYWGDRVEVTYTPKNDGNQRQEVAIKLVQLAVEYRGAKSESIGDTTTTFASYQEERNQILRTLEPSAGLLMS